MAIKIKIGVDEAGRGPWAGPVFAGIVVLDEIQESILRDLGINDSKKLSKKKRDTFYSNILENSLYSKVKYLKSEDIDKIGVYKATKTLIKLLVEDFVNEFSHSFDIENHFVLIDGLFPNLELILESTKVVKHECIIKGDEKEIAISAASILAKVRRDRYMIRLSETYPEYQFEKHKGYGTKLHLELLKKHGICPEHRKSFKPIQNYDYKY